MSEFIVVAKAGGTFSVENDQEVLAVLHSLDAAETACAALNGDPGPNAFDHFCGGRWSTKRKVEA